jgi:hypothetical protein
MRNRRRSSGGAARRALVALLGLCAAALASCAGPAATGSAPATAPLEAYRAVLGHNAGLSTMRAVVEARIAYAGREVSLPGVLLLDGLEGFRLELLDPLDRPVTVFFAEERRITQYRPAQQLGSSLGVFRDECVAVDPGDWVAAVLGASRAPVAGETVLERGVWGGDRVLERYRAKTLYESVRYRVRDGKAEAAVISWFCGEDAVMRLRLRGWVGVEPWRFPTTLELEYPLARLTVRLDLREIEGNPPPVDPRLRQRPGPETRWTRWNLPQ